MEHSPAQGSNRLAPLMANMMPLHSRERATGAFGPALDRADAFVLAHAFAGVLRAMVREGSKTPPIKEISDALTRLVRRFTGNQANGLGGFLVKAGVVRKIRSIEGIRLQGTRAYTGVMGRLSPYGVRAQPPILRIATLKPFN
jgi:hypothetical protein